MGGGERVNLKKTYWLYHSQKRLSDAAEGRDDAHFTFACTFYQGCSPTVAWVGSDAIGRHRLQISPPICLVHNTKNKLGWEGGEGR